MSTCGKHCNERFRRCVDFVDERWECLTWPPRSGALTSRYHCDTDHRLFVERQGHHIFDRPTEGRGVVRRYSGNKVRTYWNLIAFLLVLPACSACLLACFLALLACCACLLCLFASLLACLLDWFLYWLLTWLIDRLRHRMLRAFLFFRLAVPNTGWFLIPAAASHFAAFFIRACRIFRPLLIYQFLMRRRHLSTVS